MNLPPPTVIHTLAPTLIRRLMSHSIDRVTSSPRKIELPEHVQEVIGQDSHEQPGLVGWESEAVRLAPAEQRTPDGSKR